MRVFHNPGHAVHAPASYVNRGQVKPCPEQPRRAEVLLDAARAAGHEVLEARHAHVADVAAVHDFGYLRYLESAWGLWRRLPDHADEIVPNVHPGRNMAVRPEAVVGLSGYYQADCACPIGPGTWQGALASAGVAMAAASAVAGSRDRGVAYALCRPPGHHAYADMAGGFCFLNNTAIAAQRCLDQGARRVAIVDVDVHHGNGTQGIFYERDDVLTVSLHGDPAYYYPFFAGYADETGAGDGEGCNLNVPLAQGTGDDDYLEQLAAALERVRDFGADTLLVALGLDASEHDPLAFLSITTAGFRRIGAALGAVALPSVLVQEGGYLADDLGANLAAFLGGFENAA